MVRIHWLRDNAFRSDVVEANAVHPERWGVGGTGECGEKGFDKAFPRFLFTGKWCRVIHGAAYKKIGTTYIFYVKEEDRSSIIGKRGKNIKKLRQKYGKVVIKNV